MEHWVSYPFVRFLLFFLGGILIAIFIPGNYVTGVYILLISSTVAYLLLMFFYKPEFFYSRNILYSSLASCILLLSGIILTKKSDKQGDSLCLKECFQKTTHFKAKIISESEDKGKFFKVIARTEQIKSNNQWLPIQSDIILWLKKEEYKDPFYGDIFIAQGSINRIEGANYYRSFDPQKYYRYKNIFFQASPKEAIFMKNEPTSRIMFQALSFKKYFTERFRKYIKDKEALGITEGIILGKRDGITSEIRDLYSGTGTMHLLSVSGLHIGLLYQLLLFLFGPLSHLPKGNIIRFITIATLLIGYSILTGLVPPVLRSVIMFLIFLTAKALFKKHNPYNTLTISAFIILLYDPFNIMDIGFQLTYLAMAGIIFLQPKLSSLIEPERWLTKQIWNVTTGGFAATIVTFPISLYYFHAFPLYFSLSNLHVAPLSYIILWLGVLGLMFSQTDGLLKVICCLLEKAVFIMNEGLRYVLKIPNSVIKDIYIDFHHMLFIYAILILFILIYSEKKFKLAKHLLAFCFVFSGIVICEKIRINRQNDFMAFFVKGKKAFADIKGRKACIYADSTFGELKLRQEIYPALLNIGITSIDYVSPGDIYQGRYGHLIKCGKREILVVRDKTILNSFDYLDDIDLLVYEPGKGERFQKTDIKAYEVVINKKYKKVTIEKEISKNINLHIAEPYEYYSLSILGDH